MVWSVSGPSKMINGRVQTTANTYTSLSPPTSTVKTPCSVSVTEVPGNVAVAPGNVAVAPGSIDLLPFNGCGAIT